MSSFTVRAAKAADEPVILAIAKDEMAAQERMDPRFRLRPDAMGRYALYLRDRLREMDSTVFVAEEDGRIVGVAVGSIRVQDAFFETRRYGYVSDLMVVSDARRRGVGRTLWTRVALWFRSLGVAVVRLHVATRSPEARAFWKSAGAEDFLAEAWIDLPAIVPWTETDAEPAKGAASEDVANHADVVGGERLAGDSGII
jgi:GNAT superfamily N-acetyltransferase